MRDQRYDQMISNVVNMQNAPQNVHCQSWIPGMFKNGADSKYVETYCIWHMHIASLQQNAHSCTKLSIQGLIFLTCGHVVNITASITMG